MELLSKFDPFLADHLAKYGNKGHGVPSYLSNTIYNEIIKCMGEKVRSTIAEEVKEAKYFSVSVDSTPDAGHSDQLTVTVRYFKNGKIFERFLMFLPTQNHTAAHLAE